MPQCIDVYHKCLAQSGTQPLLLQSLVVFIAHFHQAGVVQQDLYPNNFLLSNDQLYAIDGGSIKTYNHAVHYNKSVTNLALLLAQFPCDFDIQIPKLLAEYTHTRQWQNSQQFHSDVLLALTKKREKRLNYFTKKIFRNCTDFSASKRFKYRSICYRPYETTAMQHLLSHLDEAIETAEKLKLGRSSTVAKLTIDNRTLVIKRYNIKNFWHRIKRLLQTTRAARAWHYAHYLLMLGLTTPRPVAFVEKRIGPFSSTSYFITEYIEGESLAYQATKNPSKIKSLLTKCQPLLDALWQQGLVHGDLKATNIILDAAQPYLIDFDSMKKPKSKKVLQRLIIRDQNRFAANWSSMIKKT